MLLLTSPQEDDYIELEDATSVTWSQNAQSCVLRDK
jgi:hypothetical protein